ncbi:hypothetical protein T265_06934 [Opisthorchis viverrini]|uniref:Uncharacterized protein n=1 Tax=Opisthorchis viverrini TaxID=6198 RepID=A0A075ACV2_OPIVI|nr:hypothetical protein T265_06934 [Opisthorchis viverrini]KER25644.1 hypothetical protein T265_06934 [Opisthorchis viverrini]
MVLVLAYHNHSEVPTSSGAHSVTARTPLTPVGSHILWCLQPGTVGITRKASSTDSTTFLLCPSIRSRVGHLSASTTLSWAWKTVPFSTTGSAYVTRAPTSAASGAGYIFHWKYALTPVNPLYICLGTDSPTPTHTCYDSETTIIEHLKKKRLETDEETELHHEVTGHYLGVTLPGNITNERFSWVPGESLEKPNWLANECIFAESKASSGVVTITSEPYLVLASVGESATKQFEHECSNYQVLLRSYITAGRRGGIHPLNPALTMSPRMVMKRLQSNCQARRTDQQRINAPELPTFHNSAEFFDVEVSPTRHFQSCLFIEILRVLFSMPNSEWRKQRGGKPLTWQRSMKEITKRLGATHLPGWGPRDPHCAWLETLQDMAANRWQWRSCYKSWLYGSETSVLNTDVMLSMTMMMMTMKSDILLRSHILTVLFLESEYFRLAEKKYTNLQINLVFTRYSTESSFMDILQLNVLHTGHLMIQLGRFSRYRSSFHQETNQQTDISRVVFTPTRFTRLSVKLRIAGDTDEINRQSNSLRKIQYRSSGLKFRNQVCNDRHGERIFDETVFGFVTTKCSSGAFTKGIIESHNFNAPTDIHRKHFQHGGKRRTSTLTVFENYPCTEQLLYKNKKPEAYNSYLGTRQTRYNETTHKVTENSSTAHDRF